MWVFVIWLICAIVAGMVGSSKGRSGAGWALGILFGPIGLLIIAVMPANSDKVEEQAINTGDMKKCPFCAELIKREAIVCKHCGKDLPPEPKAEIKTYDAWDCPKCGTHNQAGSMVCMNCFAEKP